MAKKKEHSFNGRLLNWQYCSKCGLLTLKNEPTRKAMKASCPGAEDYDSK